MHPTASTPRPVRHETFYLDEGDLVMRIENTLYRFHAFHLQRATTYFDGILLAVNTDDGNSDEHPLDLDGVKSTDFEHLLWFFYESAYKWSGVVDAALTEKWESVLRLAEKFDMQQAANVACFALGCAAVLSDVRKISLCVKHGLGKDWVLEELRRVITRETSLTTAEGRELGTDTTVAIAAAREALRAKAIPPKAACSADLLCNSCERVTYYGAVTCFNGVHECDECGERELCPSWDRRPPYELVEDSMFPCCAVKLTSTLQAHDATFRMHSYHLKRTSQVFEDMFNLPRSVGLSEGINHNYPIVLDLEARQMENLLWFLYDSAYEWSYKGDPTLVDRWEDILIVADIFNMSEVCRVATYALDHNGGLPDIRKISLCVRYDIDKSWALEAIKRVCARPNALSKDEARDVGVDMTASIASIREAAYKASGASVSHLLTQFW
ncbi:hypothetical protein HDZ31DRAFT_28338 [Schizophyllum fasciatum]